MTPQTFIFFGISGSGKGAQADLLMKFLKEKDPGRGVVYVETGRLLREVVEKGGGLFEENTKKVLDSGGLLEEFVPVCVWSDFLRRNLKGDEHIVFDGVSRRIQEAPILESALKFYGRKSPHAIFLEVSEEAAAGRLVLRGRNDDGKEEIKRRFAWFNENVIPAIKYFEKNPYFRFHKINGNPSEEEVREEIIESVGL